MGSVFFAFSTFVIRTLAALSASLGIAAMQRINVTVPNPLFLGFFMGTALLAVADAALALLPWSTPRSLWLLASGLLYLFGSFLVTVAFNVLRNDQLASADAQSSQAAAYWSLYLSE